MAKYVIGRDNGPWHEFDSDRIRKAVKSAFAAVKEERPPGALGMVVEHAVGVCYAHKMNPLPVEKIQDIVEHVLLSQNLPATARAYMRYRDHRATSRADTGATIDVLDTMTEYLDSSDWRVNENANQGYSLGGLILNSAGKLTANYWLSHVYPAAIGEAHRSGAFHIHDLDMLTGYCAGWSLRTLLTEGLNGVPGKVEARPPKHFSAAVGQIVNFLGTLQNEWAGAQAFSSFDTYMAPFVRADNLDYLQVKQYIQELIYNLNVPSRWGTQTPFTNLTFDLVCPEDLRDQVPLIGGEGSGFTYGDLAYEMGLINRAYLEVMAEGDAKGRVFTFPIPTYNITPDFDWDSPTAELLFEVTAKYGLPYFQNFLNSDLDPTQVRSMCCRLQLDLSELEKRGNGLFGSAEQTGSIGVVTLNCARIGYETANQPPTALKSAIDELLYLARDSLELKRKTISRLLDSGLFPYTKRYLGTYRNHFSTIGVNGLNEMVRNYTHGLVDIKAEAGQQLALEVLSHIRRRLVEFQKETGHMYNLEATPAEGSTYRFARADQKAYPHIKQAGTYETPYYTNSSQLPADSTDDLLEALDHQLPLQRSYTGGTVFHIYLGERLPDGKAAKALIRKTLENYPMPYFTLSPVFSICPIHGYLAGEHEYCPICDETIDKDGQ